ncbi:hypothetical protein Ccrd_021259 [Cynara cardunculus var. scolymus]|uniref:ENTH/VHS-like protein n=1 Tax=Cynara cardunculus var. scolymus TaxID=59895 RepID=A0A118JZW6_CYNCS|nr:hypothetical protein Ccrd_021259 [Cynara cardunculus var. scolymus]
MAAELVNAATSEKLSEMDWTKSIQICELVTRDHRQARDVIKAIKKRLGSKNKDTQLFAVMHFYTQILFWPLAFTSPRIMIFLTICWHFMIIFFQLLEVLMNNIGEPIHTQVIDTGILPLLVKLVKKKSNSDLPVREKIFLLLDATQTSLGGASGKFPQYYSAYYDLVSAGVQFSQRPEVLPKNYSTSDSSKSNSSNGELATTGNDRSAPPTAPQAVPESRYMLLSFLTSYQSPPMHKNMGFSHQNRSMELLNLEENYFWWLEPWSCNSDLTTPSIPRYLKSLIWVPKNVLVSTSAHEAFSGKFCYHLSLNSIIQKAGSALEVLRDVLDAIDTRYPEQAKDEFTLDLVEQCSFHKQRVMHLAVTSRDEKSISQAIELNDQLQQALSRHEALVSGRSTLTATQVDHEDAEEEDPEQLFRRMRKGKACVRPEAENHQTDRPLGLLGSAVPADRLNRPLIRPISLEPKQGPITTRPAAAVSIPPPPAKHVEREKFFQENKADGSGLGGHMRGLSLHSRNASSSRSDSFDFSD